MALILNEDQTMLGRTAKEFVQSTTPLARLRKLRDTNDLLAYSPDVWARLAELGWLGIPFSEADGGLGLGLADVVIVTEALGRLLAPEPFVATVVLAGSVLALGGTSEQKAAWLPALIEGKSRLALAQEEKSSRADLRVCRTRAERAGAGFRITGEKTTVLGGSGADAYLVVARTSGAERDAAGLSVFLVPKGTPGLKAQALRRVDSLNAASVTLEGVEVPASAVVGELDKAFPLLDRALDRATVALSGEMLGGMSEALDRTLVYLREREQFGVRIGSFQALQHRAARLFVEVELSRSAVLAAARAVDDGSADAKELVSVAKARCSDAFMLVANEAVQMHAGIGMTDEHDIGFFLKRAKSAEITFGDSTFHRNRFATIRKF